MEHERDWASLPADMLALIASLLTLIEDFMVFRGVCTFWRAAARKDIFVSVSKVPLLMLAEEKGTDERVFYSLSKRNIFTRIPLPDTIGRRCMDVGFGWVLTLADSGEACLLKPLSSARIHLPNFKTFPQYKDMYTNPESIFIKRAWLIDNPAETSNFKLLVLVNHFKLGFWRKGDEYWTSINHGAICPVMTCIDGNIFILDQEGNLLAWDLLKTDLSNPQGLVVPVRKPTGFAACSAYHDYLVGSTEGILLLIRRNKTVLERYAAEGASRFRVKRLDLTGEEAKFTKINDLGTDAIFLGFNAAVCVDANEFPGVLKPNCIYFTDDCFLSYHSKKFFPNGGGKDMGVYNVGDGSIERFEVESYGRLMPPQWIFPSL